MDGKLITSAMMTTFKEMGVKIQKYTDNNVVYITVPKFEKSTKLNPMTGDKLARRIQEVLDNLCGGNRVITIKYKVVDE